MSQKLVEEYTALIPKLLGQSRVSILIGAGCSVCAGLPVMKQLTDRICSSIDPTALLKQEEKSAAELLNEVRTRFSDAENVSIEDYLSEIQDIDAILKRQEDKGVPAPTYPPGTTQYCRAHTQLALSLIKSSIREILGGQVKTTRYHRQFCGGIHHRLGQGRERTKQPVNYFILNYDTLLEDALALEGISINDGFVGGATAWWDPTRLSAEESMLAGERPLGARVYKMHGSIDWIRPADYDFPMRVRSSIPKEEVVGEGGEPVVIYPSSVKYKETQHDPYALMMSCFRKRLGDTESHVLAIMGYGFNDEHINVEIHDGLKASKGALSLLVFLGTEALPTVLEKWVEDPSIGPQVLILGKKGIWKEGKQILQTQDELDWYKFERISEFVSGVE